MSKISALPVERNSEGAWLHPAYDEWVGDRECTPSAEFLQWLESHSLEYTITAMDLDEPGAALDEWNRTGSFAKWKPESEPPAGEGWFIAAIFDTEDGPVSIWFRSTEGAAA